MHCLVTGAGGLIGSHLTEWLATQDVDVTAVVRRPSPDLDALEGKVTFVQGDIMDRAFTAKLIQTTKPDIVFHLAAQSLPRTSWEDIVGTFETNLLGTVYLLEAIREHVPAARVVMACSSSQYASSPDGSPIREGDRLEPLNPYAVSKMGQDRLAVLYGKQYGMPIMRVRPFFLIGPRKRSDFCSDFSRGIVAIERGEAEVLKVGNIDAVRDLLDVRDGARGLWAVARKGEAGEVYNVCSGNGYRIRDVLEMLRKQAKVSITAEADPNLLRPLDEPVKVGDVSKLRGLGWEPEYGIEDAVSEILKYWREQAVTS